MLQFKAFLGFFHKNNFIQWEKIIIVNLINTAFLIKNLIPILKKINNL